MGRRSSDLADPPPPPPGARGGFARRPKDSHQRLIVDHVGPVLYIQLLISKSCQDEFRLTARGIPSSNGDQLQSVQCPKSLDPRPAAEDRVICDQGVRC